MGNKICVIGGGAAGMMAACTAADFGGSVTLFERNKLCGIKVNITGKGRCNLTNNCSLDDLILNTPRNGRFLYSAYSSFSPQDVMDFFENENVPVKTERGNRVFPTSDKAKDITGALSKAMHNRGVSIEHSRVMKIITSNGQASGVELFDGTALSFDKIIIATGGLSYPKTGSTGDGYSMAKALGHTIMPTRPSLVPLICRDDDCGKLEGLSLKNVKMKLKKGEKPVFDDFGEMIFTSNGVSGPMILSASAHINSNDFPLKLFIDFKPALDFEALDKRILKDFSQGLNRNFSNIFSSLLPAKLIPVVVERSQIPFDCKVNAITKAQRHRLINIIKGFELDVTDFGSYNDAVITSGGVSTKEVYANSMESRLVKGLYFAGEVIDVDAYTGGFNLQIAWSTGYLAGKSSAIAE